MINTISKRSQALVRIFLIIVLLILSPLTSFAQYQDAQNAQDQDDEPVIVLTPDVANDTSNLKVYGPTVKQDHIWQIATKLRPQDTITVQQMIMALLKENPQAFDHNNINGLKNGQMLKVPPLGKILAISPDQAKKLVDNQNTRWKKIVDGESLVTATQYAAKLAKKTADKKAEANPSSSVIKPNVTAQPTVTVIKPEAVNAITPLLVNKSTPAVTPMVIPAPMATIPSPEVKVLQQQLTATEQQLISYKKQLAEQVNKLEKENAADKAQLLTLNRQIAKLSKTNSVAVNQVNTTANSWGALLPKTKGAWWIIWAALFLIVLLWLPSPKRKSVERQEPLVNPVPNVENADIKDEYDFMNSEEGIAAKLDLARAYIDMDDYPSAKWVLKEVLEKGTPIEKSQAKQLLDLVKV